MNKLLGKKTIWKKKVKAGKTSHSTKIAWTVGKIEKRYFCPNADKFGRLAPGF